MGYPYPAFLTISCTEFSHFLLLFDLRPKPLKADK